MCNDLKNKLHIVTIFAFFFIQEVLETAKSILLWGSTPDAVLRLNKTELRSVANIFQKSYFEDQCHDSLCDFLQYRIRHKNFGGNFIQVSF